MVSCDFYSSAGDKGDSGLDGPPGLKGKPGEIPMQDYNTIQLAIIMMMLQQLYSLKYTL